MPHHPPDANPDWVIRSVAVRTRDGPERLDQAYRRLVGSPLVTIHHPRLVACPSGPAWRIPLNEEMKHARRHLCSRLN
jgi:hypothetical protein